MRMAAKTLAFFHPQGEPEICCIPGVWCQLWSTQGPCNPGMWAVRLGAAQQQSSGRGGTLVSCFVPLPSLVWQ